MTRKPPNPLQSALPMSPAPKASLKPEDRKESSLKSRPNPKLRFECRQLDHAGSKTFFVSANPATDVATAVSLVLSILYDPESPDALIPPTRSVTLILRSMSGVAYTTGLEIDNDHKEIHFSLDYIRGVVERESARVGHEIQGVLVHEMVHAWQWNGLGTAPGGLIEGIADFVRLKAGLSPPHWKKEPGAQWDAGYQHTAYFLEWIEERYGKGSVRRINAALQSRRYEEGLWEELFSESVGTLWSEYKASLKYDVDNRKAHVDTGKADELDLQLGEE